MLPQHLIGEKSESRVLSLDTGQTGKLRWSLVYQARGKAQNRTSLYIVLFTADDMYQEWDEEDQDYNYVSVAAEFRTREDLDFYITSRYKEA